MCKSGATSPYDVTCNLMPSVRQISLKIMRQLIVVGI